eukprot:TRINITY_DN3335_c0_g1_i4.p1 TRINITY_DN3335_c0_g1~~TRINITY_DN3335_c0_g1_i4.p1  ORF type:complete len:448 (-),score=30.12 TRINITY_DN3335_c0_g1_i4:2787-4130(-)
MNGIQDSICLQNRYVLQGTLGGGTYGTVKLAYDYLEQQQVAIKMIVRASQITKTKYLVREVLNHRKLIHPHVVQMKDVFLTRSHLCIVMEYVAGTDLHKYIRQQGVLTEAKARWFCQQQVFALDYIHRMGVTNRDIKLENCLVSQPAGMYKPILKICDFGFSKDENQSQPKTRVGTLQYMAPEVVSAAVSGSYDGSAADVWSCGVMLYIMLFMKFPFGSPGESCRDSERKRLYQKIITGEFEIPQAKLSSECLDLLKRMLERNRKKRITLPEIMQHPWFLSDLPEGFLQFNKSAVTEQLPAKSNKAHGKREQYIRKMVEEAAHLPAITQPTLSNNNNNSNSVTPKSAVNPQYLKLHELFGKFKDDTTDGLKRERSSLKRATLSLPSTPQSNKSSIDQLSVCDNSDRPDQHSFNINNLKRATSLFLSGIYQGKGIRTKSSSTSAAKQH